MGTAVTVSQPELHGGGQLWKNCGYRELRRHRCTRVIVKCDALEDEAEVERRDQTVACAEELTAYLAILR
jgi:hypothetical protein